MEDDDDVRKTGCLFVRNLQYTATYVAYLMCKRWFSSCASKVHRRHNPLSNSNLDYIFLWITGKMICESTLVLSLAL